MTQPPNPDGPGFVEALLRAAGSRRAIEQVLRMYGGERIYLPRRAVQQGPTPADVARGLVFASVGRATAVEIVRQRCQISASQARRVVAAAVRIRGQAVRASHRTLEP